MLVVVLLAGHGATRLLLPATPGSPLEAAWFAGAKITALIQGGQWWRVVIAPLHHLEPLHLMVNLLMVGLMGGLAARMLGAAATLATFLGTAWLSTLVSAWLNPESWSLGASGGGYGLTGALLGALAAGPLLVERRSQGLLLCAAALIGLHIAQGGPQADRTAHAAGLILGFVAGAVLTGRAGRVFTGRAGRRLALSGALAAGALVATAEAHQWLLVQAVDTGRAAASPLTLTRLEGCRWAHPAGWVARAPGPELPAAHCITNGLADACLLSAGPSDALETAWFGGLDCPSGDRPPDATAEAPGWHLRRRSLAGPDAPLARSLWVHALRPVAFAEAHLPDYEIRPEAMPALVALRESVDCTPPP